MLLSVSLVGLLSVGAARAASCPTLPFPPSANDVATFVNTTFDYLIVGQFDEFGSLHRERPNIRTGGGTAGVALAARYVNVTSTYTFRLADVILGYPSSLSSPSVLWKLGRSILTTL